LPVGRAIGILGLAVLLLAPAAWAWGAAGHMVVAQIAYDELDPAVRTEADRLIALLAPFEPRADHFVPAAYWMDEVRRTGFRGIDHWHYTNRPINAGGLGEVAGEDVHNVVWAVEQALATLGNRDAPDLSKAWMLRILLHTVGDVHQPLHCVTRFTEAQPQGDRGGNLFLLAGPPRYNLHAYWDGVAGLLPEISPQGDWQEAVHQWTDRLQEEVAAGGLGAEELAALSRADSAAWARESFELALSTVYDGIEEGGSPTPQYEARAQAAGARRLVLAGHRLAQLLNQVLAAP
jgi:hypothetical protein